MKQVVSRSEAIILINAGKMITFAMSNGYGTIKKKPKGVYEIRIYTNGDLKPEIFRGGFAELMRIINKFEELYLEGQ